jgi:hypothetical protein
MLDRWVRGAGDQATRSVAEESTEFPALWGALRLVPERARKV